MCDQDYETEVGLARARSAAYAFVAYGLRDPDLETLKALSHTRQWAASMRGFQEEYPELLEQLGLVSSALPRECDRPDCVHQLRESHAELFGHAVRGTCPPYEIEYGRGDIIQQASELADVQGFYEAFGLAMIDHAHERVDHASVECEFMSTLASKLVYAIEHGNVEAEEILNDAQRSFLTDHLGRWLPALAGRLQEADATGFYGQLGRFIQRFIEWECRRFDTTCGPAFVELRAADPERDTTIQCGVEDCCPGACPDGDSGQPSLVQLGVDHPQEYP